MTFTPPDTFNCFDYFLGQRIEEGNGGRRALLTDSGSLDYQAVFDLSGRYAALLVERGVQPQERVMIALRDGPDYVGALFGTLRMGAVAVMVNPDLLPERIRTLYEYTGSRVALVGTDVCEAFHQATAEADPAPEVIEVGSEEFRARLSRLAAEVDTYPSSPDDPAIFLFSGGTTGEPKAVVQTHRSFANTTELYGKGVLGMGPDDVTLSVPKLFFGYATGTNLLFPFSVGATSALFPERCTVETLLAKIADFEPTVLVNVPTMVNHMVNHPSGEDPDFSSLRLATSAGEALPRGLHQRWDARFGVPLLDGLGTAEMWHIFISNRPGDVKPGTLGKPVPGFEVMVCDEDGIELGPDEVGYLRVCGDSLATGYWEDEEKTRHAFQDGWYVSSDMISKDEDGYVTYRGRADDMLKVSGKWLSPQELENCLLEHESVGEVAVVGAKTEDGLVKPKAFVTVAEGVGATQELADALQEWAKSRLEPYKYPREVVFMDELPRTHLGKVDRGRLTTGGA